MLECFDQPIWILHHGVHYPKALRLLHRRLKQKLGEFYCFSSVDFPYFVLLMTYLIMFCLFCSFPYWKARYPFQKKNRNHFVKLRNNLVNRGPILYVFGKRNLQHVCVCVHVSKCMISNTTASKMGAPSTKSTKLTKLTHDCARYLDKNTSIVLVRSIKVIRWEVSYWMLL